MCVTERILLKGREIERRQDSSDGVSFGLRRMAFLASKLDLGNCEGAPSGPVNQHQFAARREGREERRSVG